MFCIFEGIIDIWTSRYRQRIAGRHENKAQSTATIFAYIYDIFLFCCFGISFSIIAVIFEILTSYRNRKKHDQSIDGNAIT